MIVGVAGHVDHGKTALVRALTGVNTDRLKEEQARGISIDLGFAYLPAGDGSTVGFVDVPGHEKFVRNMLAGATGVDAVLLVVAADDGVMPQTREHLAIVDLLGVSHGLVALTKIDLASPERVRAVEDDIRELLATTGLAAADILPVSTISGEGVEDIRAALLSAARTFEARSPQGRFRLAVDRCFNLTGIGAVVTGPVVSGVVRVGDAVVVSPGGLRARVRSIHAQNQPAERGLAGQRCALNLAGDGVTKSAISRGNVVLDPALHAPTGRIDATLRLLASESRPLAHWTPVRLHHGAAEIQARAALLGPAPIAPGGEGRIQLVLDQPIAAAVGDRFILRDTSGSRTIGGGRFLDLRAPHRRRSAPPRLEQLNALAIEGAGSALAALLGRWPHYVALTAFARDRALDDTQAQAALGDLAHASFAAGGETIAVSPATWARLAQTALAGLEVFHRAHPASPGLAAARLAPLLEPRLPPAIAAGALKALVDAGVLLSEGGALRTPEHRFGLDPRDQGLWTRIAPLLAGDARFRPPRASEIAPMLSAPEPDVRRVLKVLARRRDVVEVAPDHFFMRETVEEMARIAVDTASDQADGQFSAAQLRDRLNNGRKVAIQILEYFDRRGLTLRHGALRRINASRLEQFTHPAP